MKIKCKFCEKDFDKKANEEACSLKCRLMSRIEIKDSCWVWKGWVSPKGYGYIRVGNNCKSTHRVSYEVFIGDIEKGMCVCHTCDNPSCINPEHLWIGSNQDNAIDREKKGRGRNNKGENHGRSKLKESDIPTILKLLEDGIYQREIARRHGVHQATIFRVSKKKSWKHVITQN